MKENRVARKYAKEVAGTLRIEIAGRATYTYSTTGAASAWRIRGSKARLAVNVEIEDEPYALVETGRTDNPHYHMLLKTYPGLGWVECNMTTREPELVNALGAAHPILG